MKETLNGKCISRWMSLNYELLASSDFRCDSMCSCNLKCLLCIPKPIMFNVGNLSLSSSSIELCVSLSVGCIILLQWVMLKHVLFYPILY